MKEMKNPHAHLSPREHEVKATDIAVAFQSAGVIIVVARKRRGAGSRGHRWASASAADVEQATTTLSAIARHRRTRVRRLLEALEPMELMEA
jgi:hypothetical protein